MTATLTATDVDTLRALHTVGRLARGNHPVGHPYRVATERLSAELAAHRARGVPVGALAAALGVSHAAVIGRIARHGHGPAQPSQPPYLGRPPTGRD